MLVEFLIHQLDEVILFNFMFGTFVDLLLDTLFHFSINTTPIHFKGFKLFF